MSIAQPSTHPGARRMPATVAHAWPDRRLGLVLAALAAAAAASFTPMVRLPRSLLLAGRQSCPARRSP